MCFQVFHICDNGRKISFLCPNGTIFQQSQLICDWWFKVDCSKSTELYEQSAEQLAEEERKRADARKMKSEFHRTQDNANYYDTESADYDGRQNGRTNPYGQSAKQNQIPITRPEEPKSVQHFGPNNVFDNPLDSGRYFQGSNNELRGGEKTTQPDNYNQPQPLTTTTTTTSRQRQQYHDGGSNYQPANNRQRNRLDTQAGKFNYEHGNKFQDTRQNYQSTTFGNAQDHYRSGQSTARNEKPEYRGSKSRTLTRNNLLGSNQSQKVTPTYMETTTFRTTTASPPPPREFQQFAESAAFVSNRGGNRFVGKSENNRQYYYQSYEHHRGASTIDDRDRETTTVTPLRIDEASNRVSFTPKTGAPSYPGPTYAPIYKPRTTTVPPYETTLQYTPTTETPFYSTSYYRQEDLSETTYTPEPVTVTASTFEDYSTTESFATTYNDQPQTPASIGRVPPAANYPNQFADNRVTGRDTDRDIGSYATTRPYLNTESYGYNSRVNVTSTVSQDAYPTSTPYFDDARGQTARSGATTRSDYRSENSIADVETKGTTRDPSRGSSPNFRQNLISSTEKPWSTNVYQQSGSTSKTLSPYDTSFTYKQGKVLSTLGPYVPFTKNYVYSTITTTARPPITASTYSPTIADYRITTSNLIPKVKAQTSRPKDKATYLPEADSSSRLPTTILEDRPYAEREHALSMLHSLQGLEKKANDLNSVNEAETRGSSGRNIHFAPGPSTLHSLALYFATASDSFESNETAELPTTSAEHREGGESLSTAHSSSSVELPTSILTQHTISSYAELFNLNNALEGNATVTELTAEADDNSEGVDDEDLEIEQSEGPLNGAKKTNNTKLRELAQVFTHALSAYLQDPDTFKKVLTEIRPTEPTLTTTDAGQFETTTSYPTTAEEYSSVTKEKDEVLDFSDDTDPARRRKPGTVFPTTTLQPPTTTDRSYSTYYTTPYDDYYSTPLGQTTQRPIHYPSTTLLPPGISSGESGDYTETSTQIPSGNTFAYEVNHVFGTTAVNDIRGYDADTRDSTDLSPVYDNYFPSDEDASRNRIAGFHNNTGRTFQPYGKNVKPADATPINNYVALSTAPSFQYPAGTTATSWSKGSAGDKPDQDLAPPHYQRFGNVKSFEVSNSIVPSSQARSTTPLPRTKPTYEAASSTVRPFRIRYYESTPSPEDRSPESLVTARSSYVKFRNNYNHIEGTRKPAGNVATTVATPTTTTTSPTTLSAVRDTVGTLDPVTATVSNAEVTPFTATVIRATSSKPADAKSADKQSGALSNDHWTSSPTVTQLWETTVFVDPRHINQGLEFTDEATQSPTTDGSWESELTAAASTARPPTTLLSAEDSDATTVWRTTTTSSTPSPWQWAPNDNDAPVAFTLLPTTYPAENTATPTPIVTTRSSITTTITSSVTTNSVSRENNLPSTSLPFRLAAGAWNTTENEVIKAQEMFGKLNETSSDTLMRVMKQADSNETVRQLVLLLISHCNGPRNKTQEQEKEQLLDALLKMPVNEFSSEESREIVAGINRLSLPIGTCALRSMFSS